MPDQQNGEYEENLKELEQLARTAGLEICGNLTQERQRINPAYFIGSGKVNELSELIQTTGSNVVIFDEELSPAQIRNLEKVLKIKVIDRSTLILDIFAKHARTREAKTQVELAQLEHLLPRLTRQWSHLSRQVGGIGTKGPGETQLETDRRLIRTRIEKLRRDLATIDRQRTVQRKNRKKLFRGALIGYTNVGKSTIMNMLSGSQVLVENQLFATLDSTIRRVRLNDEHEMLLGDTVGFIRKLPHNLVASFKSTLDEVREADILLHVVDITHPQFREQMHVVMNVLEDLGVHQKPMLIIFNKIDKLKEIGFIGTLKKQYPSAVFISAIRHIGVESLKKALIAHIEKEFILGQLEIPIQHQKFIHYLHSVAVVQSQEYLGDLVNISFKCHRTIYWQLLAKYQNINKKETEET